MKINYLRNLIEDKRISMDEYAENLINYQKKNYKNLDINEYTIKLKKFYSFLPNKWKLRYARYIDYPNSIKKLNFFDITHVTDHSYAHLVKNIKSKVKIVTVSDLIPLIFEKEKLKDLYNPIGRSYKRVLFRYSINHLKYFDKIIAISENTKKDILKFTSCNESKIEVININIPEDYFNTTKINKDEICRNFNIPINSKKILITGNGFYKNHITSIKILENLLKNNINVSLIWIGHKGDLNLIKNKKIINKITKIPFIKKIDLPKIYKVSDVVLTPSLYEGLGLVNLEAMKCGIPVITSNTSSMPEIVGPQALMCDPMDHNKFSKYIIKLLKDEEFYKKISNYGISRSKLFNNDQMHKKIIKLYIDELKKKFL